MKKYFYFFLSLHTVIGQDLEFPSCWIHYGECLDQNQPPLDVKSKVKPLNNENVIIAIDDILTIEDCSKECENYPECQYYTLYKNDLNKDCQLVLCINWEAY